VTGTREFSLGADLGVYVRTKTPEPGRRVASDYHRAALALSGLDGPTRSKVTRGRWRGASSRMVAVGGATCRGDVWARRGVLTLTFGGFEWCAEKRDRPSQLGALLSAVAQLPASASISSTMAAGTWGSKGRVSAILAVGTGSTSPVASRRSPTPRVTPSPWTTSPSICLPQAASTPPGTRTRTGRSSPSHSPTVRSTLTVTSPRSMASRVPAWRS
jgi:hypothetical protein